MKRFYKENRVFVILMGVVLVCFAIIIFMALKYVMKSNNSDVYGNRLDGMRDVVIKDTKSDEIESTISEMENVESVTINIHGKIIYFDINFASETTQDIAKDVAKKCLELFEEDYRNFYDMQFLFTRTEEVKEKEKTEEEKTTEEEEQIFPIIGYIKAGNPTITWSNNAL